MRFRLLAPLLVLMATAAGFAETAPFSVGVDSFPRAVHGRHVMRYTRTPDDGKPPTKWTEVTTLQAMKGDLMTFIVQETRDGEPQPPEALYAVLRGDAIFIGFNEPAPTQGDSHAITAMAMVLKFPLREGASWLLSPSAAARRTVEGQEWVEVPAGRFLAVRIHDVRDNGAGTSWYVPTLGVIKSDMLASHSRVIKELVRYERPPP